MPLVPAASTLAIRLLGSTRASLDGADLPLPASRKTRAILAFLLLADRPVSRQQLCELFFDVPDDPRAALRWSLSKLRGVLEADGVERVRTQRDQVSIDTAGLWVDALALRSLPQDLSNFDAAALAAVLGWSPEPLLADADLPNRPDYAAWLVAERHRAQTVLAKILTALSERYEGNPAAQIEPLQRLIALDPLDAAAYQRLIAVLVELGRRSDAEALAGQAERALAQNGIDPGEALRQPLRRRSEAPAMQTTGAIAPDRASDTPVVAVLPVVDLSMVPLPGHVSDGFFEGLVHALSRFQSLVTIAGASTSRMRGVIDDPIEIARRLGADILIGGSLIATRDGTLRFRWRAIDGQSARIVTSGEIEGHCDDVWDLQESAAQLVAVEVEPRAQAEALRTRTTCPTASANAYDHYLRGLMAAFRREPRDFATALDHFERAIEIDPGFHPALALAPWVASYANRIRTPAEREHFAAMSRAALRHGADDARTLATAGGALCYMARDHAAAWQAVHRAIAINPNEHTAWSTGGWMHAMNGNATEAHRMFDHSARLNPLASNALGLMAGRAMAELLAGNVARAESYVVEALDGSDSHPSALMTGVATAALLDLASLDQRRAALLQLYPEGIESQSIRHLPFEQDECQDRYFAALRKGGVPG